MNAPFRRRRRRIENQPGNNGNSQQMMTLSLFIMLLAFFIVLNAISQFEEIKTEQVRRSVLITFSRDKNIEQTQPSPRSDPAQSMKEGHAFDRLDALFEAQIAGFEAVQSKSRGVMMVDLPLLEFQKAVNALNQVDMTRYPSRRAVRDNFFLPTLISILRSAKDGAPTRMEVLYHLDGNPARLYNEDPKDIIAGIRDTGALARTLEQKGLPQNLVNVGLQEGRPDRVSLVFRKYVPYSPVDVDAEEVDE